MMNPLQSSLSCAQALAGRRVLACIVPVIMASFGVLPSVYAQEVHGEPSFEESLPPADDTLATIPADDAPEALGEEPSGFPEVAEDSRRIEVRRALLDDGELNSGVLERRSLTAEERSAFRLELLRAVRSAYPEDARR